MSKQNWEAESLHFLQSQSHALPGMGPSHLMGLTIKEEIITISLSPLLSPLFPSFPLSPLSPLPSSPSLLSFPFPHISPPLAQSWTTLCKLQVVRMRECFSGYFISQPAETRTSLTCYAVEFAPLAIDSHLWWLRGLTGYVGAQLSAAVNGYFTL